MQVGSVGSDSIPGVKLPHGQRRPRLPVLEMIEALDHIQLAMPADGEKEAVAFFCGVLGFREVPKPPTLAQRGGCWFSAGSCKLHIGVDQPFAPQKKAHPAFLATDLDEVAANLMIHGSLVRWDEDLPDRRRLYTEDPFGNRIEIMQSGDGFSQK